MRKSSISIHVDLLQVIKLFKYIIPLFTGSMKHIYGLEDRYPSKQTLERMTFVGYRRTQSTKEKKIPN